MKKEYIQPIIKVRKIVAETSLLTESLLLDGNPDNVVDEEDVLAPPHYCVWDDELQ